MKRSEADRTNAFAELARYRRWDRIKKEIRLLALSSLFGLFLGLLIAGVLYKWA